MLSEFELSVESIISVLPLCPQVLGRLVALRNTVYLQFLEKLLILDFFLTQFCYETKHFREEKHVRGIVGSWS